MALTQISTNGIKNGTITGTDLATNIDLVDNQKLRLGTNNDLQLVHDGSHSNIINSTGVLKVRGVAGQSITFRNGDDSANVAVFNVDDATHLYFDSAHKFSTNSTGIRVIGNCVPGSNDSGQLGTSSIRWQELNITDVIDVSDNGKIRMGDSDDLQIYHSSGDSHITNSVGNLNIINSTNGWIRLQPKSGEEGVIVKYDGAVELYHDNIKRFETTSSGITVAGNGVYTGNVAVSDNSFIYVGNSGDLALSHTGTFSKIQNSTGDLNLYADSNVGIYNAAGSETKALFTTNGSVELYYDNSKKFDTTTYGAKVTGRLAATTSITGADNVRIKLGDSDDLQLFHSGSHSFISNTTGTLQLESDGNITITKGGTENMARFLADGAVELYYDNGKKLETTSQGIEVTSNSTVVASTVKSTGSARADMRILAEGTGEAYLWFDASNGDLSGADYAFIQHQNSSLDLIMANYANDVIIKTRNGSIGSGGLNTAIHCHENGAVELYHDGSKKFETASTGVRFPNNGTLSQNGMYFETGQNTGDYATMFGVTNYPDASGFSDQNDGHWAKIKSKGGCVVIINSDGGRNDGRNNYDHFSVYHKEGESSNGKRAFSVDHTGGIQCGQAGINIDREWGNQPSFSMTRDCNDGTNNTDDSAYFRFHGTARTHSSWTGGSNGSDFSANMLLDGGNYNGSDRRTKTDIVDCPYGLAEVLKLRPRKYQLVNSQLEKQGDDNINLGFIAQEIMEHIPECVNYLGDEANTPNEKGWARAYALDTNEIVAVLTKAIQELAAKVAVLESKT